MSTLADPDELPARRRGLTRRQVRDILSLLLVAAGVLGLITVAFTVDDQAGWAAVAATAAVVGVALGIDRT